MPGFVAKAGLAEKALPVDQLAEEILSRVEKGRGHPSNFKGWASSFQGAYSE
jgi:hypothetical protein